MSSLNRGALCNHGHRTARGIAVSLMEAALKAADPLPALSKRIRRQGSSLRIGADWRVDLSSFRHVYVVGAGKASLRVGEAIEEALASRIHGGLIAVKQGSARPLRSIEIIEASHPVPDASSVEAATRILDIAHSAGPDDLLMTAISGGSSSLLALPPNEIAVEDLQSLYRVLLLSGAPIEQINTVRKHVSRINGGRLALAAKPARVINLTVSDVIGDPLDVFAGPVVSDSTTAFDALAVLRAYGLLHELPQSICAFLKNAAAETPKSLDPARVETPFVLSHRTACRGAAQAAEQAGLAVEILSESVAGESWEAGAWFAAEVLERARRPLSKKTQVLVACGEMTVAMPQGGGTGGPNQEAALSAARVLQGTERVVTAFLGTDGTDGPTDAAGGLVDGSTASRASRSDVDLGRGLERHDAYPALQALGDLIVTGHTGTNVADLLIGVVMPAR